MPNVNLVMLSGRVVSVNKIVGGIEFIFENVHKYGEKSTISQVRAVAFGKLMDACANLKEGDKLYIEGRKETREAHGLPKVILKEVQRIG